MAYAFRIPGIVKAPIEDVAEVLDGLAVNGELTPARLVEVSRPEGAKLHECFEWNDTRAAEKWRQEQARQIISNVVVVTHEADPVTLRAFVTTTRNGSSYKMLQDVINDAEDYGRMLRLAKADASAFVKKYEGLKDARVVDAVDALNQFINE